MLGYRACTSVIQANPIIVDAGHRVWEARYRRGREMDTLAVTTFGVYLPKL